MNQVRARMKFHRLLMASSLALPIATACTMYDGTGSPNPGLYWGWVCPDGDAPLDASAPIAYVASGSCGEGGPFTLSVDGCEMFGSWSALGLSNVETTQYASSPALGGWSVTATTGGADGGVSDGGAASSTCTAHPAAGGDLTFTCSAAATSATTCQSTLTPVSGADGGTN
jgi:hypothetical protein